MELERQICQDGFTIDQLCEIIKNRNENTTIVLYKKVEDAITAMFGTFNPKSPNAVMMILDAIFNPFDQFARTNMVSALMSMTMLQTTGVVLLLVDTYNVTDEETSIKINSSILHKSKKFLVYL